MTPVRDEVKKNVQTDARYIAHPLYKADPLISNTPYFDAHQGLSNPVKSIVWSTVNLCVWDKVYETY